MSDQTQNAMTLLCGQESHGSYGMFGIEIKVCATKLPDLKSEAIWLAGHNAKESVEAAIMEAVVANDDKAQAARVAERDQITSLFDNRIFVEEIPNGYCSRWCCKHLPWFKITTPVGRFTVGWRKRVISIDWSETVGTQDSKTLFAFEDVTKDEKLIHAWSVEKATGYILTIISSANSVQKP